MKIETKQEDIVTGRSSLSSSNLAREKASGLDFTVLSRAVAEQFARMSANTLYRVKLSPPTLFEAGELGEALTKNLLWDAYLAAFPAGSNPKFRERTEHDCQCCKGFVRTLGGVVAIVDGELQSIWDIEVGGAYQEVVDALAALVRSAAIDNLFLHPERSVGTAKTFQQVTKLYEGSELAPNAVRSGRNIEERSEVLTWNHFSVNLPAAAIAAKKDIGPKLSEARATHDVLKRGLEELTLESVDTVLELIAQNSLYRGEESRHALEGFRKLLWEWSKLDEPTVDPALSEQARVWAAQRDSFVWLHAQTTHPAISRIRNTAIGTLLIDLSNGMELEDAVKKFETSVMAPANYKRPTALVSKAMIEKARKTIDELGLSSALERRFAVPEDVTVNNVLYADRSAVKPSPFRRSTNGEVKPISTVDAFDALVDAVPESPRSYGKVQEIGIDKFLADVLPRAKTLEVLFENRHAGNLVSLIAPVDPTAKRLFKWPNAFSWSYAGEFADSSVKERVKRAGGSVTGDLCCRLAWNYADDLDFHMVEPGGRASLAYNYREGSNHIYYGNVRRLSANGGMLDLDANGCDGMKAEPVENIFYADKAKMSDGVYELSVHNYARRTSEAGFEAEIEFGGQTLSFAYDKAVRQSETVVVAKIRLAKGEFTIEASLPSTQCSRELWGLQTQTFRRVSLVTLSPNYWDTTPFSEQRINASEQFWGVGNKHWFFMLDSCFNDGKARGFYNEFLSAELEPHRKTMEMVGAKMHVEGASRQLSGLGFSSTRKDSLMVRAIGAVTRVLKVVF